jgi:hypothetical protein
MLSRYASTTTSAQVLPFVSLNLAPIDSQADFQGDSVTRPVGYREYSQVKEQLQSRTLITSPSPLTSPFRMLSAVKKCEMNRVAGI